MLLLSPRPASPITELQTTLLPAVPKEIMMSHGQKSKQSKLEGGSQTKREAPGLAGVQGPVAEEEATATTSFSSTALVPVTPREMPDGGIPHDPQSPQRASSPPIALLSSPGSQVNQGSRSQGRERFHQHHQGDPESLLQSALNEKLADLVHFLLLKYQMKKPTTQAEIQARVIRNYQNYFPSIFRRASECLQLVFGIAVKEVNTTNHSYVLVTALGLTYDGLLSDIQGMPKTGLLIIVLGIIFVEGNRASEEVMWEVLRVMGVFAGRGRYISSNPRRLISEDFVQEQYLVHRLVPNSNPATYEFLWGPRAYAETSRMKILRFLAHVNGSDPRSYPSLYVEALRSEDEGI
jgi:hypothetical protein